VFFLARSTSSTVVSAETMRARIVLVGSLPGHRSPFLPKRCARGRSKSPRAHRFSNQLEQGERDRCVGASDPDEHYVQEEALLRPPFDAVTLKPMSEDSSP
jgi:hypothetical protein